MRAELESKVYTSCTRSYLLYGCETWAMRAELEAKMDRTEMKVIRWMCGVSLIERRLSTELRRRLGVEAIVGVMRRGRLR